ncbi:MAG: alpha-ketoacid dehydrogenase subunit beta [Magnetococcales bacterium]|nr:alpha-ketoacid dehydrogenase subunit beta [Magnetococcales bacterium]NGZ28580.1 alpha-ketoacid dehydrogenase subunit beta [Magnetococcales bacterium]
MPWAEALLKSRVEPPLAGEGERIISYDAALNEALSLAMELDGKVFVMGQGVDDPAGMFGVTRGLQQRFGPARVFDTPLSEEGMTGIGVGAAMTGCRPVYCHNRPDFILLTFNQLVNHAAKMHYLDLGKSRVPMVVWSVIGRGWGSGAQHSQAIQGLLLGVPGLKIIMPATPYDAKGLMLAAIADNNPVLIFEHRWLMRRKGAVPEGMYHIPIGKGVIRRPGSDVTVVGTSMMIDLSLQAANALQEEGISVEVVDLRTLKPMDEELILASLSRTGRLLVVDTGWAMAGVCAEVGFLAAEKGFSYLKAPVRRLALPDLPTPAGDVLEHAYYPDVERIKQTIRQMMAA